MRVIELSQVAWFGGAGSSNLTRLDGQVGLTKATFADQVCICTWSMAVPGILPSAGTSDLRVGVSSGASKGFLREGKDLLAGSGEAESMVVESSSLIRCSRNGADQVKRERSIPKAGRAKPPVEGQA